MLVKRIVVATDFSETATSAVTQSLPLTRRFGAKITIVHADISPEGDDVEASEDGSDRDVRDWEVTRLNEARHELGKLVEHFSDRGVEISQALLTGDPTDAICQVLESLDADLLVLGSHGRNRLNRWILGSTATAVTRKCPANVLVVRPPLCPEGFRRLLVPVDFEHEPDRPVEGALALASEEAEIHLLHCWHLPFGLAETWGANRSPMMTEIREAMVEQFETLLNELILRHRRQGVSFFADQIETMPRQGIMSQLDTSSYDLVVLGSHRRRGIRRWILGSVAEAAMQHARCSVLIVK